MDTSLYWISVFFSLFALTTTLISVDTHSPEAVALQAMVPEQSWILPLSTGCLLPRPEQTLSVLFLLLVFPVLRPGETVQPPPSNNHGLLLSTFSGCGKGLKILR